MAGDDGEQKLTEIEAEIARLRHQFAARLSAIAEELRRAEARDEWAASLLRELRRDMRSQSGLIREIHAMSAPDDGSL